MQAVLDWHGEEIRVIVVHIRAARVLPKFKWGVVPVKGFDNSNQALAFEKLLSHVQASREPVIVVGDFNTTERQAGYELMVEAGLKNVHEEVGWGLGLTFPAPFVMFDWLPFSLIRIDHVFYDDAWRAIRTWITPLMDSDHQAVIADLRWVGDR
jgi:endonuclease/exonuclease/phosphatase (EEP) superfamily protein YafD